MVPGVIVIKADDGIFKGGCIRKRMLMNYIFHAATGCNYFSLVETELRQKAALRLQK